MKTFDERRERVEQYMTEIQRRRHRTVIMVTSLCLVLVLTLALFMPIGSWIYGGEQNNMSAKPVTYSYSELAQKMEQASDYDFAWGDVVVMAPSAENQNQAGVGSGTSNSPAYGDALDSSGQYVEVTDNQVEGVTEADIFKRSSEYIFYLRDNLLRVYSIAGEDSALAGCFQIEEYVQHDGDEIHHYNSYNMYLSSDCRTVTVMLNARNKTTSVTYTALISLDVTDPASIRQINCVYISGSYLSSRMVDGKLLMMTRYSARKGNIDAEDPSTFVPMYGTLGNMECLPAESIVCPEELNSLSYTVVCKLDAATLQIEGTVACLGYSDDLYVSQDKIFVARSFAQTQVGVVEMEVVETVMTEIVGISYSGDGLEALGTVSLEGSVKNQYSMDEHKGILRVVTSTTVTSYELCQASNPDWMFRRWLDRVRNVNLYCVDLNSWSVAASVIAFAPEGEDAQSVRFDGDTAYVCTAEVITFTDPVYFFDLSDPDHITWTDTGTIDGYSTSLVQLGDGYLLGIGFGADSQMKVEIYEEANGGVVSVCAYERDCSYSGDYKSYLIDRENDMIGLAVRDWRSRNVSYLLLAFDGSQLRTVAEIPCQDRQYWNYRACIIDGYLYILSDEFVVEKIG